MNGGDAPPDVVILVQQVRLLHSCSACCAVLCCGWSQVQPAGCWARQAHSHLGIYSTAPCAGWHCPCAGWEYVELTASHPPHRQTPQVNPSRSTPARVATAAADKTSAWAEAAGAPTDSGDVCSPPVTNATAAAAAAAAGGAAPRCVASSVCKDESVARRVEAACSRLVQSGLAESLVTGKVGDCCDGHHGAAGHGQGGRHAGGAGAAAGPSHGVLAPAAAAAAAQQRQQQGGGSSSAVVPFLAAAPRRRAVQVAAIAAPGSSRAPVAAAAAGGGSCDKDVCYYGVVVQSARQHTGVEGC